MAMNILFLTNSPMAVMGGYETLIMRMSDYLSLQEHSTYLISPSIDDRLRAEFNPAVLIQSSDSDFNELYSHKAFEAFYDSIELPPIDVIVCIDMRSYILAGLMLAKLNCSKAKLILGLYQPDSVRQVTGRDGVALMVQRLLKQHGARTSVVAMLKKLQREWDGHFSGVCAADFIPLPVELKRFNAVQRAAKRYRIVSVGRLDDYKTYNIFMVEIVRHLVDQGLDVRYDIYGEGPYQSKIEEEIKKYKLEDRVCLRGHLAYEDFPQVLETAYCFVGMGTAAIEAAAAAVPVVYSPPRDMTGVTHGLFHQFDVTELGGFADETNPPLKVHDVILDLMQVDAVAYEAECLASAEAMKLYSMDSVMGKYSQLFSGPCESSIRESEKKAATFRNYCDFILLLRRLHRLRRKICSVF